MSALSRFLEEQARQQDETRAQRRDVLEEWKGALDSLIGQFETWLHEADRKNALTIDRIPLTIRERRLGTYDVDGLRVRLGVREFRIEPVARYALGSVAGGELSPGPGATEEIRSRSRGEGPPGAPLSQLGLAWEERIATTAAQCKDGP